MIDIKPSAQAFFRSTRGLHPIFEEAVTEISSAWDEVVRLEKDNQNDFSTKHLLNHTSSILDEIVRLAMLGPGPKHGIVLFTKFGPKDVESLPTWKFEDELRQIIRKSEGYAVAKRVYRLRNELSSHRSKVVPSDVVSFNDLVEVKSFIESVLDSIRSLLQRSDE